MLWGYLTKGIFFGLAALGFAVLFQTPRRTLWVILLLASVGGIVKTMLVDLGYGVIVATLVGATVIGFLSVQAAHGLHAPQLVFSIPSVIPFVPGVYTYRMMIGVIELTQSWKSETYLATLSETVQNGITAALIILSLAVGVAFPLLMTRRDTGKFLGFTKNKK